MGYVESEQYAAIGMEVIDNVPELRYLRTADVRISFLACDKPKTSNGKNVFGECVKVQDLYKVFCPYDFFIIFYDKNIAGLNDEQLKILMEHELLHVGVEDDDPAPRYFVKPHDYDDFKQITNKYGTEWAKGKNE